MPAKRELTMRQLRHLLRLHHDGVSAREIGRRLGVARSTIQDNLKRAAAADLKWPLPDDVTDAALECRLFAKAGVEPGQRRRIEPDWAELARELKRPGVNLTVLWEEYREIHPEGYGYSRFCELYGRWLQKQDVVLRQNHTPGEKGFVDWAGATIPLQDPQTGEIRGAALFLMVLGASNYTYAEATLDQQMTAWLGCHLHAFEYFQAVPRLLVPDNTRTGVSRACRYDPDLNPTYQEMAMHYGVGVVPARPYRARDKAKVESGVLVAERWIIAALRHRTFFRLGDLNQAIRELLEKLNHRPFKKRDGSRASVFENVERAAMQPLPAEPFDLSQWSYARVNIDYHIAFNANFYSVPYHLVQERVEVRSTPNTVEIFHQGQRVASHPRSRGREQVITQNEHRPKSHQAHLEWTPSRMVHWAEQTGPHTARLIEC